MAIIMVELGPTDAMQIAIYIVNACIYVLFAVFGLAGQSQFTLTCIDGLIGLIPVVGDIIATALSLWLVREARALGAPWHITARMLGNVAVQGVVGAVPVAGDAFDVLFRANIRNARMLRRWLERQPR